MRDISEFVSGNIIKFPALIMAKQNLVFAYQMASNCIVPILLYKSVQVSAMKFSQGYFRFCERILSFRAIFDFVKESYLLTDSIQSGSTYKRGP